MYLFDCCWFFCFGFHRSLLLFFYFFLFFESHVCLPDSSRHWASIRILHRWTMGKNKFDIHAAIWLICYLICGSCEKCKIMNALLLDPHRTFYVTMIGLNLIFFGFGNHINTYQFWEIILYPTTLVTKTKIQMNKYRRIIA